MGLRWEWSVTMAALAAALTASSAIADTTLVTSDPAEGAVVDTVPERVVLTFDRPVRTELARLVVVAPDGVRAALPDLRASGNALSAPVTVPAATGEFRVEWRLGERSGVIMFSVRRPGFGGLLVEHVVHIAGGAILIAFAVTALRRARRRPAR